MYHQEEGDLILAVHSDCTPTNSALFFFFLPNLTIATRINISFAKIYKPWS